MKRIRVPLSWFLGAVAAAVAACAFDTASCKPSQGGGGGVHLPPGTDLACRTTGDGYEWEGSTPLETGLDDVGVTVFDTGRTEINLAEEAGLVWDSFLAQSGQGFADDLYGHGAYSRSDVRLSKASDTQVVVNDGGTLRLYTLVDAGIYESAEQDESRLSFRNDGTAQIKMASQVYEVFALTSLVSAVGNGSPVQMLEAICSEPDCTSAHTTLASDSDGRIRSITDELGYVTSYGYDGNGRLQSITFPDGRVETIGYDSNGNLASIAYPPLMPGGSAPTRTFVYDGWKLATAKGPGGAIATPQAVFSFADSGQLESLEPTNHDKTTLAYQSDTPQKGYTTVTLTDRTHIAGQNPVVMVDDPCALAKALDGMKYEADVTRDAHHQPVGVTDPEDPSKEQVQVENPTTARDRWGHVNGSIDDELGEKFVFTSSDEDGREGRAPSSFSGPEGTGRVVYAKDDPSAMDLPSWAQDLVSDVSFAAIVTDDTGAKNTTTIGAHHTYTNTKDSACPRQIVDTDKLTGVGQTSCLSADGSKLLSVTDGYGLKTTYVQTHDAKRGESLIVNRPNGDVETETTDPEGRLLREATMGFNDEEDIAYYGNGMPQADRFPGANVASQGGAGFQEAFAIDPDTLLATSDSDEDGIQAVDDENYAYYPEGLPKERDLNYSRGGGVPVGEQDFSCPWWASTEACQ